MTLGCRTCSWGKNNLRQLLSLNVKTSYFTQYTQISSKAQRSADFCYFLLILCILFCPGLTFIEKPLPLHNCNIFLLERDQSCKGSCIGGGKVRQGKRLWEGSFMKDGEREIDTNSEHDRGDEYNLTKKKNKRKGQPFRESPRRVYPEMWLTLSRSASDIPEADRRRWGKVMRPYTTIVMTTDKFPMWTICLMF